MSMQSRHAALRVVPRLRRLVNRQILGFVPDPETWPPPPDVDSLPVPDGIEHDDGEGLAWTLDREYRCAWPHRRTVLGAHAYRFSENAEYDCGWRLIDVAARFLRERDVTEPIDFITMVPPPPVYRPVQALVWSATRLADRLNTRLELDLFDAVAPIGEHPDCARRLPVPLGELYGMNPPGDLSGRRVLLLDWRWEMGRTITLLARRLRRDGAEIIRLTWLE